MVKCRLFPAGNEPSGNGDVTDASIV